MSLINNALKRAQQLRPRTDAPVAGPVVLAGRRAPVSSERGSSLPLAALIVAVMMLSGFMMWKWFCANGELKARARSYDAAVKPVSSPQPASEPKPVAAVPEETNSAAATNLVAAEEEPAVEAATNVAVAVEPPKPEPVTYKLQGIIYQPGRSSAVINGKTVVAGERVAEARVVSIDKDSAVIVTAAGQTNVLELP